MRRIGMIGIENSHCDHFLRYLNEEHRFPGSEVTAILAGPDDRVAKLTEKASLEVLDSPEDFIGAVDAAIICTRDGALHRGQATPLLEAGIPLLLDKPLATSTVDAQALVDLSATKGVPLVSASAVRFAPEVADLTAAARDIDLQAISVSGPADPDSPYSGLFFYGIHMVETAFELLGQPDPELGLDDLAVVHQPSVTVATVVISGVVVTIRFLTPADDGRPPFHAAVYGRRGSAARDLTLGPDYNLPLLQTFVDTVSGAGQPVEQDLVAPITLTEAIRTAVRPDQVGAATHAKGS